MQSKPQIEQSKKTLQKWMDLVSKGMGKEEAAEAVGMTSRGMRALRRRYLPNGFEDTLRGNGLPDTWDHGWVKNKEFSIHIKNNEDIVTWEDIRDEFVNAAKKHAPKYPKIKRDRVEDGHLLVMDIADPHMGKLAIASESGEDYNMKIVEERVRDGLSGLLAKASGFNVDKVLLVIGNDALHIDSPYRKTTGGTSQDTDGQWHEAFVRARALYVHIIECLMPIAQTHVVFNPSNHDYASGFMLADSIASWFRNADATFDIDMKHRKYFVYGKSLIGTTHGDGAKEKDLAKIMAMESPLLWAETKYRYWYCHHFHHKIAKDDIGVCIEYLRSPTTPDRWHSDNGYLNTPACEAFIHSKDRGQIARLTHYSR